MEKIMTEAEESIREGKYCVDITVYLDDEKLISKCGNMSLDELFNFLKNEADAETLLELSEESHVSSASYEGFAI